MDQMAQTHDFASKINLFEFALAFTNEETDLITILFEWDCEIQKEEKNILVCEEKIKTMLKNEQNAKMQLEQIKNRENPEKITECEEKIEKLHRNRKHAQVELEKINQDFMVLKKIIFKLRYHLIKTGQLILVDKNGRKKDIET